MQSIQIINTFNVQADGARHRPEPLPDEAFAGEEHEPGDGAGDGGADNPGRADPSGEGDNRAHAEGDGRRGDGDVQAAEADGVRAGGQDEAALHR